jgi:1,5-anhydro-D-fructose reductase (1,5-anhydro-D-mannitol-forming)
VGAPGDSAAVTGWGIVGAGTIADREFAPAIAAHDGAALVGVVSRDADRAAAFCGRHGGSAHSSLSSLLADGAVEAVYIATPNALHCSQAIEALDAGKHVLVEKPMALDAGEAREMVAAARARDRLLGVAFHLRHKPSNRAAREAVIRGDIGEPRLIQAHLGAGRAIFPYDGWRRDAGLGGGAGTLVHQGTHLLDLVRFVSSREVISVCGVADERPHEGVAGALLTLERGTIALVSSSDLRAGTRSDFTVLGSEGWLEVVGGTTPAHTRTRLHTEGGTTTSCEDDDRSPFWHELDDFQRAIRQRGSPAADGTDGLRNVELVEAVYKAIEEHRTVDLGAKRRAAPTLLNRSHHHLTRRRIT